MNPIIEVLKTKDFKRLWFIGTTGMSMRWIEQIALGFYVYKITQDEFLVGLVFFFRNIPMLLFGAFIGVLSDEFDIYDFMNEMDLDNCEDKIEEAFYNKYIKNK